MAILELHYEDSDKLFVPVAQLSVISRYTGANPDNAPLHRLGSGQWEKARRKAAEQVRDTAAELLNLYARRAARQGFAFPLKLNEFDAFSSSFPFEETPDQATAIKAVMADMTSGRVARGVHFRGGGKTSRHPGTDHAARRTALPEFLRPLCRMADQNLRVFAIPQRQGNRRRIERRQRWHDRHRHRHSQTDSEGIWGW